jgi:hypothetical protein
MTIHETPKFITEKLETPVREECDVLVVGGGAAGIIAAAAAAKNGARTILVEANPVMGGDMLAGGVSWLSFFNHYKPWRAEKKQLIKGIPYEMVKRLQEVGGCPEFYEDDCELTQESFGTHGNREALINYLPQFLEEYGVKLYLKALMVGVVKDGDRLNGIIMEGKGGRHAILAKVVIDATGDGDVAAKSGAKCITYDDNFIGMAFGMGNVNLQKAYEFAEEKNIVTHIAYGDKGSERDHIVKLGMRLSNLEELKPYMDECCIHPGPVILSAHEDEATTINGVNMKQGNSLDPEGLTKTIVEMKKEMSKSAEFLKKHVPGFENAYLNWTGDVVGARRTRHVECEYAITENDVTNCVIPSDCIGLFGSQDAHFMGYDVKDGGWYGIPYRALLPKSVENLLVAGRMISPDGVAWMSTRLIGACFLQGQAVGTAAALAAKSGITPRDLDVALLQETLKKDGAYLGDE